MADRDDEADGRPSLRPYEFPWYRRAGHNLTDLIYGDNATAQQNEAIQKLTGPTNPIPFANTPALLSHGAETGMQGYRSGDPLLMGAGALEMGLGAFPLGFGAYRGVAAPIEAYAARQAARREVEAMKGPWGNPGMLEKQLDAPQMPRNPDSLPFHRQQIEDYQNQGIPHSPYSGPLTDEQKAENMAYTQKLNQLRQGYDRMGGSYGRDVHDAQRVRPMTADELIDQRERLGQEARDFVSRPKQVDLVRDPYSDSYLGIEGKVREPGRPWYPSAEDLYNATEKTGIPPLLDRMGRNNEHIPGKYEQSQDIKGRLLGLDAQQDPHWQRIRRERDAWDRALFGDSPYGTTRAGRKGYYNDLDQFMRESKQLGKPYSVPDGFDAEMDFEHLNNILKMDPRARDVADHPELAQQIYNDFWKHERELRANGQPTNHDLYLQHMKQQERQALREMGLDPDNSTYEEQQKAWHDSISDLRGKIDDARNRAANPDDKFLDAVFPEHAKRIHAVGNNIGRYAPPTVVGAYAANKALNWPEAHNRAGLKPPEEPEKPKPEAFKYEAPPQLADPDEDAYLKHAVNKGIEDASGNRSSANIRLGLHGIFGPPGAMMMPGKISKTLWGLGQLGMGIGAYGDKRRAQSDLETMEAMKKGYVDKLPELNRDDYQD